MGTNSFPITKSPTPPSETNKFMSASRLHTTEADATLITAYGVGLV